MLALPGLSSVSGKRVVVNFDGGLLSPDGGIPALREIEQRLPVADRLRISCASLCNEFRAASHDWRGVRPRNIHQPAFPPQTFSPPTPGAKPEPNRRVQKQTKSD